MAGSMEGLMELTWPCQSLLMIDLEVIAGFFEE